MRQSRAGQGLFPGHWTAKKTRYQRDGEEDAWKYTASSYRPSTSIFGTALTRGQSTPPMRCQRRRICCGDSAGSPVRHRKGVSSQHNRVRNILAHLYHAPTQFLATSYGYDIQNRRVALQLRAQGSFRRLFCGSLPVRGRCPGHRRWPVGAVRRGWPCAHATSRRRRVGRWR